MSTVPGGYGFTGSKDLDVAASNFGSLGSKLGSGKAPMRQMIQTIINPTMRQRFMSLNQSKTDEGGPWVPNTPVTQHIRQLQGYPARPQMNRSKTLRIEASSINNWSIQGDRATFQLPGHAFYGALQHTGYVISAASMLGKARRVPRRPWIYFSEEQIRLMSNYLARWMNNELD